MFQSPVVTRIVYKLALTSAGSSRFAYEMPLLREVSPGGSGVWFDDYSGVAVAVHLHEERFVESEMAGVVLLF